jgi:L-ribulose-5-phosphate 3-epimerase
MNNRIAFNTANLVARFSGYRFKLEDWGTQAQLTVQKTDNHEWGKICDDIVAAGFKAVEVWVAHVDPSIGETAAKERRKIADDHGLKLVGLAAGPTAENFKLCQWMGIPAINGGLWGNDLAGARKLTKSTDIRWNYENHPEKSAAEMREKIEGGDELIGVALDTGWCGTNGIDAPAAVRELGPLLRHVHLKDVSGGHHTTPLGEGIVNIDGVIRALKEISYSGWYSWEDEPEDRNPLDSAVRNREFIEKRI